MSAEQNHIDVEELAIRALQGRATPAEEARLRAWRGESESHATRFEELESLWAVLGSADPMKRERPCPAPLADALLARAEKPAHPPRRSSSATGGPWVRVAVWGTLAAGIAALAVGLRTSTVPATGPLFGPNEIVTGPGEMSTVTLGDGSSVRLGPDSRLRVWESSAGRHAYLEGRAFFGVSSNPSRPFTVRTSRGEARVLGTRFEVRADRQADEFSVLVVEGEVAVAAGGFEASLREGEMSRSVGGTALSSGPVDDVFDRLGWLGDAMVFHRTRLDRALAEIRSRYGLSVRLVDQALADMTVTATFTAQPADRVVFTLCAIVGAPCSLEGDTIVIGQSNTVEGTAEAGRATVSSTL